MPSRGKLGAGRGRAVTSEVRQAACCGSLARVIDVNINQMINVDYLQFKLPVFFLVKVLKSFSTYYFASVSIIQMIKGQQREAIY